MAIPCSPQPHAPGLVDVANHSNCSKFIRRKKLLSQFSNFIDIYWTLLSRAPGPDLNVKVEGQTTVACVPVMSVCVPVVDTALCGHDALHLCEQIVVVPINLLRTFSLNLRNEIVVAIKPGLPSDISPELLVQGVQHS